MNFIAAQTAAHGLDHITIFNLWKRGFFVLFGVYLFGKDHGSRISEGDKLFNKLFMTNAEETIVYCSAWMMRPRRRNMNNKFVLGPTSWIWYRTHGGRERNLTLHLKLFTDEQNENKSLNEERYKKSFRSFWGISGVLWLQLLLGWASELTDYDMTHGE